MKVYYLPETAAKICDIFVRHIMLDFFWTVRTILDKLASAPRIHLALGLENQWTQAPWMISLCHELLCLLPTYLLFLNPKAKLHIKLWINSICECRATWRPLTDVCIFLLQVHHCTSASHRTCLVSHPSSVLDHTHLQHPYHISAWNINKARNINLFTFSSLLLPLLLSIFV